MPKIPDHFYRVSVKALILDKEKRFLLTKEDNGFWELPGGGLDFGEEPQLCLAREINEEMGLKTTFIAKHPSYFLTSSHRKGQHWIASILYETRVQNLNFKPSNECVEVRFFNKEEALKERLFSNVEEFIRIYNPNNHELKMYL